MIPTSVETIRSSLTGDSYYRIQHSSGLTVYVYPKEGSTSAFASFAANFGSINTAFQIEGEATVHRVPDGTAHYLEHKLFESPKQALRLMRIPRLRIPAISFPVLKISMNRWRFFFPLCRILTSQKKTWQKSRESLGRKYKCMKTIPNGRSCSIFSEACTMFIL